MSPADRAIAEGATTGFVKVLAHKGRIIGATVVGAQAGEVIAPLTLAVSARLKLSALAGVVLPYPTLSELGKRAAGAYFSPKLFDNPVLKGWVRLAATMARAMGRSNDGPSFFRSAGARLNETRCTSSGYRGATL